MVWKDLASWAAVFARILLVIRGYFRSSLTIGVYRANLEPAIRALMSGPSGETFVPNVHGDFVVPRSYVGKRMTILDRTTGRPLRTFVVRNVVRDKQKIFLKDEPDV